jgi:hypothetical protein
MAIFKSVQFSAFCEECGEIFIENNMTEKNFIKILKENNWKIKENGKITICNKCNK